LLIGQPAGREEDIRSPARIIIHDPHDLSSTGRPRLAHVANAIAFLASSLCENTTGEVITVDGGFSRLYFRG
jgi:NAD(P)-dependent dehydrogenase (short-subunit alcohol dehydrogenase family)